MTVVAMMQGWSPIMHRAMRARGPGLAPAAGGEGEPADALTAGLFFVVFVLLGGFVLIKLFAGVVIDKFNRLREERSGSAFMSDAEKEWVETRKLVQAARPLCQERVPTHPVRAPLYKLVSHRLFEWGVMLMIVLNVISAFHDLP